MLFFFQCHDQLNQVSRKMMTKKKSRKFESRVNPSPTALVYKGPSRLPKAPQQDDVYATQLNNQGSIVTSAAGLINTVFDAYSQLSTPSDWTNLSGLYTEFRILSMEIEFIPWNTYNQPTTSALAPIYSVEDRTSNVALGSLAAAMAYDSMKVTMPSKRFVRTIKMNSTDEAVWTPVGSSPATASRMYIKLYSSGNVANATLYDFVTRIIVQLRGRQ